MFLKKTIQREIDDLRAYLAESEISVKYDKSHDGTILLERKEKYEVHDNE